MRLLRRANLLKAFAEQACATGALWTPTAITYRHPSGTLLRRLSLLFAVYVCLGPPPPFILEVCYVGPSSMVMQEVHGRDVVQSLIRNAVRDVSAFDWLRQLRIYPDMEGNILIRNMHTTMAYAYEYIGAAPRLVSCYCCAGYPTTSWNGRWARSITVLNCEVEPP